MTLEINIRAGFLVAGIAFYLYTYTDSPQSHLTVRVCKGAFIKDITDDQNTKATTLRRPSAETPDISRVF